MARKTIEKNIAYDDERELYYVTLDYGKDIHGKRIKKVETFRKKSEAKKCLIQFQHEKINGSQMIPIDLTVEEWLKYWMDSVVKLQREKSTISGYENILKKIIPELGNIKLQKLTKIQIQNFYNKLLLGDGKQKLSSNTVK